MFAESLAWSGDLDDALHWSTKAVAKNSKYAWLFIEVSSAALHSHLIEKAAEALTFAEKYMPNSYRVSLYKGRVAEADRDAHRAIELYREAARNTDKDGWPSFYLSRALLREGLLEEALEAAGHGRDVVSKQAGRAALNLESALMQQEMMALVLLGRHETARDAPQTSPANAHRARRRLPSSTGVRAGVAPLRERPAPHPHFGFHAPSRRAPHARPLPASSAASPPYGVRLPWPSAATREGSAFRYGRTGPRRARAEAGDGPPGVSARPSEARGRRASRAASCRAQRRASAPCRRLARTRRTSRA